MKRLTSGLLVLCILVAASNFSDTRIGVAHQVAASAEAYLPDPSLLAGDWVVPDRGERTKSEVALAGNVIAGMQRGTPSAPGPDIPVPIADGCWSSVDQVISPSGDMSFLAPPDFILDPSLQYFAEFHTSTGMFEVELDSQQAAEEVNNFVCLAKAGFYDGTPFFRTLPDLLIQGGDPTGTGTGGPGYTFGDEVLGLNDYAEGVIAYANSSPDQNGSQFFIAAGDLNGAIANDFPVFGHVVAGIDEIRAIAETDVQATFASPAAGSEGFVVLESLEIVAHAPVAGPFLSPIASTSVAPRPVAAGTLTLEAVDIAFIPTELTMSASAEPVTIKMENTGAALHNFSIDSLKIDVDVNPGETVDIVIPAGTAPGTYDFYCNVAGHKEAGMVGTLIVK